MGQKPPAPVVGGQDRQGLVHEDAATLAGRELAAVIIEVIEGLEVVIQLQGSPLPRIVAGKERVWKGTLSLPMN